MMGRWTLGRASASPTSTSPCVTRCAGGPVGIARRGCVRAGVDADEDLLPPFWSDLAAQGWIGLAVDEAAGGEGYGLAEAVVVVEELGRVLAPGPFVPSSRGRGGARPVRRRWRCARSWPSWPRVAGVGTVAVGPAPVPATAASGGGLVVDGAWDAVLSGGRGRRAGPARSLPPTPGGAPRCGPWSTPPTSTSRPAPSLDRTRRVGTVRAEQLTIPADRVVTCPPGAAGVRGVAAVLLAAEGVGMAAWCVATAAEHAVVREQFGRPIGQFQGVKHRCADMLCALELARAATWDAARAVIGSEQATLAAAVAGAIAADVAYGAAKDCIQVLGRHRVHVGARRPPLPEAGDRRRALLLGGGEPWRSEVARLALAGVRGAAGVELPPEAEGARADVRAFLDDLRARPKVEWNRRIADSGYLVPHWPVPWGRDAGALEQLVVDEEFARARVRRPHLAVGAWALPTVLVHGSDAQKERWVAPTLRGELSWCQMFSEPGAGSDLASIATKAVRVEGGWRLTGQKVWTSMAAGADLGICLARTDPAAPRHEGIGCFVVDMRAEGVEVRPLRELTGAELFNEVFLTDVFVPDDSPGRRTDGRVGRGPDHAGQRAGVDGAGLVDGPGRRGAGGPRGRRSAPAGDDTRSPGARHARRPRGPHAGAGRHGRAHHAPGPRGRGAGARVERPQAARRRARPGGAGGGPRAARRRPRWRRTARRRRGSAGSSATAACRSPAGRARSSAT